MRLRIAILLFALALPLGGCLTLGLAAVSAVSGAIAAADRLDVFTGPVKVAVDLGAATRDSLCNSDGRLSTRLRDRIRAAAEARGITPEQLRASVCGE